MDDSVDVPAREVGHVLEQGLLDEFESLSPLLHSVHVQCLHREGLYHQCQRGEALTRVVRVLLEHLLTVLETLLELLVVVELLSDAKDKALRASG